MRWPCWSGCVADLPEKSDWQSRVHALLGLCYQHLGDEERQLASFRQAVRHEPGWAEAKFGLAAALTQTGRYDESLGLLSELLAQQNASKTRLPGLDLLHARTVLGNTLRRPERDRDWAVVDRALKQAEAQSPKAAELPLLRAEVLAGQKRLDEAEKTLAEARMAHPERFSYWALAADLAARQNQLRAGEANP